MRIVFGACEPHLLSGYFRFQRPYGTRNINSPDAGYLIPLVQFRPDEESLRGLGEGAGLPRCIDEMGGRSTVRSPLLGGLADYLRAVDAALAPLDASLFGGFTRQERRRCLERSNVIRCIRGDRVLKVGGIARNVFVVLDGRLEVVGGDRPVAVLGPGEVFGETAYLLETRRTFDVDVASEGAELLCLSEHCLRSLTADDPALASKLMGNLAVVLSRRLAKLSAGHRDR